MKRLVYILLVMPIMFAACENHGSNDSAADAVLTLTSSPVMEIESEGGEGVITYNLENASNGVKLTATCAAEWVTILSVNETITFEVAANEGDRRNAVIVVAYGNASFNVIIQQLSVREKNFKANYFTGIYYGSIFSPGLGNYYMILSDNGFNEQGKDLPNSKYYSIDLYAPIYDGDMENITLPLGTYALNVDSEKSVWTIGYDEEYSAYRETDNDGLSITYPYESATLVVTEEGATLNVTIEGGVTHKVVFEGEAQVVSGIY